MMFVLRMAWRETRASWLRLGFFFLCVGLGVAAIVVLRSVVQDVRITLSGQARSALGADLVVQSSRPLDPDIRARLATVFDAAGAEGSTSLIETQTMVAPLEGQGNGSVKLVEVRGVQAAFPYYGEIVLADGVPYSHALVEHHGAIVQPELLVALGLHVGDSIRLAGHAFTVRGALVRDRVQRTGFALGPRVYVDLDDLRATSLLGFGSRASYQWLVKIGGTVGQAAAGARDVVKGRVAAVRTWQTLEDQVGENLTVAENYLSLVGFVIVVLGGIGVWSVTRVIVRQKIRAVAILKCLGAASSSVLGVYVIQVLSLAACGCVLGVVLAAAGLAAVPARLLQPLGVTHAGITPSAAAQGIAVGLLVSLLFALVPLLEIRRVKPLLLLRADGAGAVRQVDWQGIAAGGVIGAALVLVAVWQASSLRAGVYVSAGLAGAALVLYGAARLLVRAVRPLVRSTRFALRHAVVSLARPGGQTRVVLLVVGLGAFFILGVRATQANLLADFAEQVNGNAPDFVLIDVQRDQIDSLAAVAAPYVREAPRVMPLIRARVTAVDGRRLHLPTLDDVRGNNRLSREFGMTFRSVLEPNERLAAGRFWTTPLDRDRTPDGADTEVSVESDLASGAGLEVGDLLQFDVAGAPLKARVTSIRTVAWRNSQNGGFVFVLRPGPAVARLAQNYVAFLQTVDSAEARGALQRDLVRTHPNVSVIDVRDVLASVRDVVDNMTAGITIIGAVMLLGGVLILVGAVAMTKFQRLYDAAIYRTLGASTRMLATMIVVEYTVLGALAGALAAGGAAVLSWALASRLFDIEWRPAPALLLSGMAVTAAAVAVVGLAANVDVLLRKPLSILRRE